MQKKYVLFFCWLMVVFAYAQSPFVVGSGLNFIPVVNTNKVPKTVGINMRYMLETGYIATEQGLLTLRTQYLNTSYFLENTFRYRNNAYESYEATARLEGLELAFGGRVFCLERRNNGNAPYGGYLQFECSHIWYKGTYDSPNAGIIAYNLPDLSQNTVPLGKTYRNGQKIFASSAWGFNAGIGYQFKINDNFMIDVGCTNGYLIRDIIVNQTEITSEEVANTSAARRLFNIYFLSIHTGIKFRL
jgi:hypothetical protein